MSEELPTMVFAYRAGPGGFSDGPTKRSLCQLIETSLEVDVTLEALGLYLLEDHEASKGVSVCIDAKPESRTVWIGYADTGRLRSLDFDAFVKRVDASLTSAWVASRCIGPGKRHPSTLPPR